MGVFWALHWRSGSYGDEISTTYKVKNDKIALKIVSNVVKMSKSG